MIQRIQSIWLLLAAVASLLTFKFSFYFGQRVGGLINEDLNAASGLLLIIFAAATGIGSFIAIFLYKDRKTQLRIAIVALLAFVLSLCCLFYPVKEFHVWQAILHRNNSFSCSNLSFTGGKRHLERSEVNKKS